MAAARWTPEQYQAYLDKGGKVPHFKSLETPVTVVKVTSRRKKKRVDMLAEFLLQLKIAGIPAPTSTEFIFHAERKWRADLAWPAAMLLVEYEGGIHTGGAHTRGKHFESDCEKYNEAALLGFSVLRFTYDMVRTGLALDQTERALERAKTTVHLERQRAKLFETIKEKNARSGCVLCQRHWSNHKDGCLWPQLVNE